jgi:hypothetical protein
MNLIFKVDGEEEREGQAGREVSVWRKKKRSCPDGGSGGATGRSFKTFELIFFDGSVDGSVCLLCRQNTDLHIMTVLETFDAPSTTGEIKFSEMFC